MKHLWDVECMDCGRIDWVSAVPYIAKEIYGYNKMVCTCGATGQSLSMFKPGTAKHKDFLVTLTDFGV